MSIVFVRDYAGDSGDAQLKDCIAADDCLRIAYGKAGTSSGSVARVGESGQTIAVADVAAVSASLGGIASGTLVQLADGWRAAHTIAVGDLVAVSGGGHVAVAGIHVHALGWRTLGVNPFLRPVLIPKGALGGHQPSEDVVVAPGQMIVTGATGTVPVPAFTLIGHAGVARLSVLSARYIQLVLAEGSFAFSPATAMLVPAGVNAGAEPQSA